MKRDFSSAVNIVTVLTKGQWVKLNNPQNPERANFVICCELGDWSGFRTLAECEAQYDELKQAGRPDGYYWVEER